MQEPRVRVAPKWRNTDGDDAAFLSGAYGLVPDPWQSLVVDDILAVRADGRWSATRCGLSVPRQNGKNAVLEVVELHKLVVLGRKILHTAHEVKTARKAYLRLCAFFEDTRSAPELAGMIREIRRTNGQEAIFLHEEKCDRQRGCGCDGASIEFIARSKGSGRGFTVEDLVMEEAQQLTASMGTATAAISSSGISGDSTGERRMERGRVLYALSDGMGAGAEAKGESASALRLLFDLYDAGFSRDVALESVNRLLLACQELLSQSA